MAYISCGPLPFLTVCALRNADGVAWFVKRLPVGGFGCCRFAASYLPSCELHIGHIVVTCGQAVVCSLHQGDAGVQIVSAVGCWCISYDGAEVSLRAVAALLAFAAGSNHAVRLADCVGAVLASGRVVFCRHSVVKGMLSACLNVHCTGFHHACIDTLRCCCLN